MCQLLSKTIAKSGHTAVPADHHSSLATICHETIEVLFVYYHYCLDFAEVKYLKTVENFLV